MDGEIADRGRDIQDADALAVGEQLGGANRNRQWRRRPTCPLDLLWNELIEVLVRQRRSGPDRLG
jgi:hypothetical protein